MPTPSQPQQHPVTVNRTVRATITRSCAETSARVVNTSDENVEDACMFAWTQFLSWEFEHDEVAYSWLTTVAIREAVKLDRRTRRTSPLHTPDAEVDRRRRPQGRSCG